MRKAFTLIELIVALAILAIMMMFASAIFRVSVDAQRMAVANGEIMQKLRVITEQLDADFRGALLSYGGQITLLNETYTTATSTGATRTENVHSDSIAFFANGDFQSTQQYGGKTIVGNVASILYGPPDPNSYSSRPAAADRLLLRRQTILAPLDTNDSSSASATEIRTKSDWQGEYYCASLEEWRLSPPYAAGSWGHRPVIKPNDLQAYLPMYLAKGVDNFTISYLQNGVEPNSVKSGEGYAIPWYPAVTDKKTGGTIIIPRAVKFEFTLYDSRGIIPKGRKFTHIVLWGG
jgi:prepilin-type N-terminal cleavage/methylation domain-containing protein